MTTRALLALAAVVVVGALAPSCGPACREIETRALSVSCDANAQFRGELHLDSRALYDTFLRDQCTPQAPNAEIEDAVSAVDFDSEAVFVASRPRDDNGVRCIASREVERVEVCEDGLRVTFLDDITDEPACPGRWTVAFALSRTDLRSAIAEE